jgi:hypothetical protein
MALDKEFLGRLDREIASLKERLAAKKWNVGSDHEGELLRETEARLAHLEELRRKTIEQSTGD